MTDWGHRCSHGHSHGLADRSIVESRDGVKTVSISLAVLTVAAVAQTMIFISTGSVALLADLIHNFGDGLTAIPLGIAFYLRSSRGERWAGLAVVLAIFVSAMVALYETVLRFIHPSAAPWRQALSSPALTADGNHARVESFVSLGVVGSAIVVALGAPIADPVIGVVITLVILKITWNSWRTIYRAGAMISS
jgi:divalent metal cation (Fe/Co/Zn/Cd) transporter